MKNMFKDVDEISKEARVFWDKEQHTPEQEYLFPSFELGWFRGAYIGLYTGMNRTLSQLENAHKEIANLKSKLEKYENE